MAKDINKVTDDISLIVREMIDATENAMVLEVGLQLNKGADAQDTKEYLKKQMATNKQFDKKLNGVAKTNQQKLLNLLDNIAQYTSTNNDDIKKEVNKGMKMVVRSAKNFKNQALKKVSRLEKYKTSATYVPDIKKSIIETTQVGIDNGLPVTYKNGRKVSYKAYMEMAVRTGIQQEIGNTQLEVGASANIVFYVANEFADCADDHRDYQGKVYYDERYRDFKLNDEIKDRIGAYIRSRQLLSIQSVRDGEPYFTTRPNCRHTITPMAIDDVLQDKVQEFKDKKRLSSPSYRPDNYELTKEQRYNERQIRKYKNRIAYFQEIYDDTRDKTYLEKIQRERKFLGSWQKRQRAFIKEHPQLFRDYDRESPKRLMPDLGISKFKLKIDPNKPPTPIDNTPPSSTPPPVELQEDIKEHYNMPQENDIYLTGSAKKEHKKVQGKNILKDVLPKDLETNPYELPKQQFDNIFYDIAPHIEKQGFNGVPRLVTNEEFKEIEKESGIVMFRGYYGLNQQFSNMSSVGEVVKEYRKDMEEGTFFVDNTGGAMYGRGMYFAYSKVGDESQANTSYEEAKYYGSGKMAGVGDTMSEQLEANNGIRIDKATIDPSAKILSQDEVQEKYEDEVLKLYFNEDEQQKLSRLIRLRRENINGRKRQYDLTFNRKIKNQYDDEERERIYGELEAKIRRNEQIIDDLEFEIEDLYGRYQNFRELTSEVDDGIKATTLGIDGYTVREKNYFVLLNRSKLVLLDDEGEYIEDYFNLDI